MDAVIRGMISKGGVTQKEAVRLGFKLCVERRKLDLSKIPEAGLTEEERAELEGPREGPIDAPAELPEPEPGEEPPEPPVPAEPFSPAQAAPSLASSLVADAAAAGVGIVVGRALAGVLRDAGVAEFVADVAGIRPGGQSGVWMVIATPAGEDEETAATYNSGKNAADAALDRSREGELVDLARAVTQAGGRVAWQRVRRFEPPPG